MLVGLVAACLMVATSAFATELPFTGLLTFRIGGGAHPFVISAPTSGIAQGNGSGGSGHLTALEVPAHALDAVVETPVTDPAQFPIVSMKLDVDNSAGSFSGSGGAGFGGPMPLAGSVRLCTYPEPCSAAVNNIVIPLAVVGQNGTSVQTNAGLSMTVIGAPWTTGTAAVGTLTAMGGVSPLSATGATSGQVKLATPVFISTNSPAAGPLIPTFATLTLHFVPEPTTLVLLATGVVGMAAYGRSRRAA